MQSAGHGVVLQNAEGKYLMQFRDGTKGINNPLNWDFFGGSSEGSESVIDAAVREMAEELGMDVKPEHLEVIAEHNMKGRLEYLLRYSKPVEWGDFEIHEGAGCAFLTKDELLQLALVPRVKFFVEKYL